MNTMHMMRVVARKEIMNIRRNKGLLVAGLYVGGLFGVLNVLLSGHVSAMNNTVFSTALLVGVFVGYSFSGQVFLREKREKVIETLLCTPLSLKAIWLGKVVGATVPAYLFSLLSVSLVILVSNRITPSLLLPSIPVLIHVFGVVPVFIASTISAIGLGQFLLGMRENKIMGFLIVGLLLPFMYPSILGGLVRGEMGSVVSWLDVGSCLIAAVLLLAFTTYASRYLNKEKIVTTLLAD